MRPFREILSDYTTHGIAVRNVDEEDCPAYGCLALDETNPEEATECEFGERRVLRVKKPLRGGNLGILYFLAGPQGVAAAVDGVGGYGTAYTAIHCPAWAIVAANTDEAKPGARLRPSYYGDVDYAGFELRQTGENFRVVSMPTDGPGDLKRALVMQTVPCQWVRVELCEILTGSYPAKAVIEELCGDETAHKFRVWLDFGGDATRAYDVGTTGYAIYRDGRYYFAPPDCGREATEADVDEATTNAETGEE